MLTFLQMSLAGSLLILIIVLARSFLKYRLSKAAFLLLWVVAILRLLLPFSITSPFSAFNVLNVLQPPAVLSPAGENNGLAASDPKPVQENLSAKPAAVSIIDGRIVAQAMPAAVSESGSAAKAGGYIVEEITAKDIAIGDAANEIGSGRINKILSIMNQTPALEQTLRIIWLAGFILLGGCILAGHWRRRLDYNTALPLRNDVALRMLISLAGNSRIQLKTSDRIRSPMTYGLVRPVILLPAGLSLFDQNRLAYILAHELVHIRRRDIVLKGLIAFALCLHWFNPLVWLLFILANRDIELSCDEIVVRRFGIQARSAYAMTLISMAEKRSQLIACTQGFGKFAVTERIRAIMKSRKQTAGQRIFSLLLVAVISLAFATTASAGAPVASGLTDLTGVETQADAPVVFRDALGETGTLYADHVNSPTGDKTAVTLSGSTWRIESTLYTDLDVYVLLVADNAGDSNKIPDIDGDIQAANPTGEGQGKILYRLDGDLQELEPDASGTRYFLYTATLAKANQLKPANEEQANLILAAGDQWRYYTSLTEHEGAILALTLRDADQQAELATEVTQVRSLSTTILLDASLHEQHFYDTAVISPFLVRLSGTAKLSQEEMKADFHWFEPDSELYIELENGQLIFAGSWGREKRLESSLQTPGYRLGGGSAGGDETTGKFHLEQPFRFFELDMTEVTALIINGIRYPLNG
ncbi:MAG: M56 family metallopeptidase [Bacillota bacterium]|nr:M56 family metallopeptidase [Bacillota bacterium]